MVKVRRQLVAVAVRPVAQEQLVIAEQITSAVMRAVPAQLVPPQSRPEAVMVVRAVAVKAERLPPASVVVVAAAVVLVVAAAVAR